MQQYRLRREKVKLTPKEQREFKKYYYALADRYTLHRPGQGQRDE